MYYEIEQRENPPVMIGTWHEGFRAAEHSKAFSHDVRTRWETITTPVFFILDMSHLDTVTFEGLMQIAHLGIQGHNASLKHPMNRGTIIITKSPIIKAAAKGMGSNVFGNIDVKPFSTVEKALAYVNNLIDAEQEQIG